MSDLLDTAINKKENLYEKIADDIEKMIIDNPGLQGQDLPSELSLAMQYHVSRNVVREAFKVLKERGFIEIHNGARACIKTPGNDGIKLSISRYIQTEKPSISDIFEVRFALELSATRWATERSGGVVPTKCNECIQHMEESMSDPLLWAKYDYDFHHELVALSKNPLFLSLYEAVSIPIKSFFEMAWGNEKAMHSGILYHKKIVTAITKGDALLTAQLMTEHLRTSQQDMQAFINEKNLKNIYKAI